MTVHSNIAKKLPANVREKCLDEVFNKEIMPFAKSLGIKLALENLSYTSTGFGKNIEGLEEVLGVIDDGDMGITFDFCHALETRQVDNLLDKYGRRVCNVHMANKAHKPFIEPKPELTGFLDRLHGYGYEGPITLELAHDTSIAEITASKALFDGLLKEF
jgi:sugar phosphate isomerase/epimerase